MSACLGRQARSFWIESPGTGVIREHELATPSETDVLVRTLYSAVSRGTESLVWRGEVPQSEYSRMRAPHQVGEFPGPVKYGYCNVGVVEEGPPALRKKAVFCLYPHQTAYVVPVNDVTPLPLNVPPARAVLAANMETALNGLWDAAPQLGDRISVVGAGTVGCLVAWLASRIPGCEVELIDVDPGKERVSRALGVAFALVDAARGESDLVVHASGAPDGLSRAMGLAAYEATVVELSWFGDKDVALALGEAFHSRRLVLRSSQVGSVAATQRPRWSYARRMRKAISLLEDSAVDCLFAADIEFDALPTVMPRLAASASDGVCQRVRYRS